MVFEVISFSCSPLFYSFYSFFLVQKSFQGEDAMWLHPKATQKKQFAAAVISLILLS